MTHYYFSIADHFTKYPGGRRKEEGPYSAELLTELLLPAFEQYDQVHLFMDGTRGYGASFLDELFCRLRARYPLHEFREKIRIYTSSEEMKKFIAKYI